MNRIGLLIASATLAALTLPAAAEDNMKLTIGQRGNWDTAITELGTRAGIFKKHGIVLEMIYTSGSGETLQPVVSGSVDAGLAVGTLGAIGAFAKGAPVVIIGAEATGAADYWYVKASSPIKSLKDMDGHTIAFSTRGSSTDSVVRAFISENKLTKAKPTPTGNPSATLTAVMSDQVEVGWAAPPFGLKEMEEGKTRGSRRMPPSCAVRPSAPSSPTRTRSPSARTCSSASCRRTVNPSTTCIRAIRKSSRTTPISSAFPRRWPSACATISSRNR